MMKTVGQRRRFIIDVSAPAAAWRKALPHAARVVRAMATAALDQGFKAAPLRRTLRRKIGPDTPLEISVVLATDATVRRLNRTYRRKDKPTNVLSFPTDAPPGTDAWLLGDVIIAYGVAAKEARAEDKALSAHLSHLVLHGVLHLLGYDHEDDGDAVVMERLESKIMARMGFADPYALPARKPPRRTPVAPRRTSKRQPNRQS